MLMSIDHKEVVHDECIPPERLGRLQEGFEPLLHFELLQEKSMLKPRKSQERSTWTTCRHREQDRRGM